MEAESQNKEGNPPTNQVKVKENKQHLFSCYDCPVCGSKVTLRSKGRHEKTRKHNDAKDVWYNRFDMK